MLVKSVVRGAAALSALGVVMFAGAAEASPIACWAFEFVPGQRAPHSSLGQIQDGLTYYSKEFEWQGGVDLETIGALFEAHVRKTTLRRGQGSVFVSGCKQSNSYGSPQSNAANAHERLYREADGRKSEINWTMSAAELASAPRRTASDLVFMRCLTAPRLRFDQAAEFQVTPVFRLKAGEVNDVTQQFRDHAAKNLKNNPTCLTSWTTEGLEAKYVDEIDHARPGSPIAQITFSPSAALAAPKPTSPSPPAVAAAPALIVKTETSAKDAAKAWDEQVKKTLAAEAQKRAETAAKAAQANAKYLAEVEAFFAEQRKRGRAQ